MVSGMPSDVELMEGSSVDMVALENALENSGTASDVVVTSRVTIDSDNVPLTPVPVGELFDAKELALLASGIVVADTRDKSELEGENAVLTDTERLVGKSREDIGETAVVAVELFSTNEQSDRQAVVP